MKKKDYFKVGDLVKHKYWTNTTGVIIWMEFPYRKRRGRIHVRWLTGFPDKETYHSYIEYYDYKQGE